jgi:AAA+ superfamily predicted ATPase
LRILDEHAAELLAKLRGGAAPVGLLADDALVEVGRARLLKSLRDSADFAWLVTSAQLSSLETEVFALLCAIELDVRRQRIVSYLQDDATRRRATVHLLLSLLGEPAARTVATDGAMHRAGYITLIDESGPLAAREIAVAPSVVWALLGEGSFDPMLPTDAVVVQGAPADQRGPVQPLVVIGGPDRTRRQQAAMLLSGAESYIVVDAPADEASWNAIVRTATIHGLGVYVEVDEQLPAIGKRVIERTPHLLWCISSRHDLPVPSLPTRPWVQAEAEDALVGTGELHSFLGDSLPHGHRITADQMRHLARVMPAVGGDVPMAIRRLTAGPLEQLARRIRPRYQWDDLVLTPDKGAQLRELVARYRNREKVHQEWGVPAVPSAGLVAMFSGQSGTGKTTAAEVVAMDLGLDLFTVDVSAVVSKYIGETEKNLEKIFDAAAAGNLVLLFDEADALFGKRTEVSDARDRYANVEVAYLLQRLETFDGLVVLTTNLQANIDQAFLRRMHLTMSFPVPEADERVRIWERWLGTGAPLGDDLDVKFLGKRMEITGGVIRNACMTAAFFAADADTPITMAILIRAIKREFQKNGRLCTEADFGKWYHLVAD